MKTSKPSPPAARSRAGASAWQASFGKGGVFSVVLPLALEKGGPE